MDNHTFNKTILREYDIRGIVNEDLNLIDAFFLGKSFATLLKRKKYKNQFLSPKLANLSGIFLLVYQVQI